MSKNVKVFYLLDEEGRKNSISTWGDGREEQMIEAEVNERILRLAIVDRNGDITLSIGFSNDYSRSVFMGYERSENEDEFGVKFTELTRVKYFNRLMTIDELVDWEEKRREKIESDQKEYGELIDERQRRINAKLEERRKQEEKDLEQRRKIEKEEKIREENQIKAYCEERNRWIQQTGSQYLKDALKLGYKIDRKYVKERSEKEFPGYVVDYDDKAVWQLKNSPNEKLLNEVIELVEKGFDASVVWLTDSPYPDEYEHEIRFSATEAIVIRNYLGRHVLVKI